MNTETNFRERENASGSFGNIDLLKRIILIPDSSHIEFNIKIANVF
jgi:hypothetical protein